MTERHDSAVANHDRQRAGELPAIEGLRLTMTGVEIRQVLDERIAEHARCAERWKRELTRTPEDQTEEAPLLPDHLCENETDRHEWRVEVLEFVRDHLEPDRVYRLEPADLEFGELLPARPGWMEQSDFEERNGLRFQLERLVKEVRGLARSIPQPGDR